MRVPLKLTHKGKIYFAWIDEEDYAQVCKFKWHLKERKTSNPKGRFYVNTKINNKNVYMHRYLMGLLRGDGRMVDHINQDPCDNTRANLRIVTPSANSRNRPKKTGTTSKYPGVYWFNARSKWVARIKIDGKFTHLGVFSFEKDAARCFMKECLKLDPLINYEQWNEL